MYSIMSVTLLILAFVNVSFSKIYDKSRRETFSKMAQRNKVFGLVREDIGKNLNSIANNDVEIKREINGPIYSSCLQALKDTWKTENGWYNIKDNSADCHTKNYCQMTPLTGCSGGGWTLVMKIDGNKETFNYSSSYWTNKESYNPAGGLIGLDGEETKLSTYWSTSFKELCVGMKVDDDLKFISIDHPASSLYDLIADGVYRGTNVGRQKWKSLISGSSLQRNCNKEGFNIRGARRLAMVRIGIIGNQENNCHSPDSYVGFGGPPASQHNYCETGKAITTCGNSAACNPDLGVKEIQAIGYIFVR